MGDEMDFVAVVKEGGKRLANMELLIGIAREEIERALALPAIDQTTLGGKLRSWGTRLQLIENDMVDYRREEIGRGQEH